jgi:uncharacterized membrane protein YjgN (DUF898 family)
MNYVFLGFNLVIKYILFKRILLSHNSESMNSEETGDGDASIRQVVKLLLLLYIYLFGSNSETAERKTTLI